MNPILMVKALFLTLLTQCIVLIPSQIIQIIIDSGMNIGTSADYIKIFMCDRDSSDILCVESAKTGNYIDDTEWALL